MATTLRTNRQNKNKRFMTYVIFIVIIAVAVAILGMIDLSPNDTPNTITTSLPSLNE